MLRLAVLAVCALALAGCASEPAVPTPVASARELLPMAEEAAREWDPQARLVQVAGVEASDAEAHAARSPRHDPWADDYLRDDAAVGDGRAHAWVYTFEAGAAPADAKGSRRLSVTATADGRLETDESAGRGAEALGPWLDSTEIARKARQHSPEFSDAARSPGGHAAFIAMQGHWFAVANATGRGQGVAMMLDAATGGVVFGPDFFFSARQGAVLEGDANLLFPPTYRLDWLGHTEYIDFHLDASASLPMQAIAVVLRDEDGRTLGSFEHEVGGEPTTFRLSPAPQQPVMAEVQLQPGSVEAHFDLAFCTQGAMALESTKGNPACAGQ